MNFCKSTQYFGHELNSGGVCRLVQINLYQYQKFIYEMVSGSRKCQNAEPEAELPAAVCFLMCSRMPCYLSSRRSISLIDCFVAETWCQRRVESLRLSASSQLDRIKKSRVADSKVDLQFSPSLSFFKLAMMSCIALLSYLAHALAAYALLWTAYARLVHPLRHVPGPFWASVA